MSERREKEVWELEQNALRMLENPNLLPQDETTKHFSPTLHLWISPTFTPDKHWFFYKPQRQLNPQPKPFVRQMIWLRENDLRRLSDPLVGLQEGFHPEPTFEIKKVEIEKEIFENLHKQLSELSFPAFAKDEILGLDGERYGVETLGFYHRARVSWWSVYPDEWNNLVEWFEKTRNFLENEFLKQ